MVQNISVFLIFAAMASAARCAVAADTDEKVLQGEWELVSIEVQGKTLPAPGGKGGSIVFAPDGKVVWKDPSKPERISNYKIDAHKRPKQIDLMMAPDGMTVQGIYAFDDDKLKMAFSVQGPKGKRPRDFKGENVMIVIWKRQKS